MEQSFPIPAQPAQPLQQPWVGAGFFTRAAAQIIDLIIHNVLWFVVGFLVMMLVGIYAGFTGIAWEPLMARFGTTDISGYLLAFLGYIFYHTLSEGIHGATLGKLLFRLHVLRENGAPASLGQAFLRSVVFFFDSTFFGAVAAFSMNRSVLQQRLGDKAAKTIVVERKSLEQHQWPSGWRFFFAFLLALAVDGLMAILSILVKLV